MAIDNHTGRCYIVWLTPYVQEPGRPFMKAETDERVSQQYQACEPLVSSLQSGHITEGVRKSLAQIQEQWALATLKEFAACLDGTVGQKHETAAPTLSVARDSIHQLRGDTGEESDCALPFRTALTEADYKASIKMILEEIRKGNAYEVCLTDQMTAPYDPLLLTSKDLYSRLRDMNRSKFGAFLKYDMDGRLSSVVQYKHEQEATSSAAVAVCCSSPELFLKVDADGWVESRPIKGTRRRGRTPAEDAELVAELMTSEKDTAENMMIVDLVRNDLGRVCIEGSVSVPHFLTVETYAAVHHMVSVVRGKLRYYQRCRATT